MSHDYRPDLVWTELAELRYLVDQLLTQAPHGYSSVSSGSFEIRSNEGLIVQGSAKVEGWLVVTGTERVTGLLEVLGTLRAQGAIELSGPTTISGDAAITGRTTIGGETRIAGAVTLDSDLTLGNGRIVVGALSLERFSASGRIASTGIVYIVGAGVRITGSTTFENHVYIAGDLDVAGAKNFRMPHPTKSGHWLRHGSTESPVSGTEYTGRATLDENGEAKVTLPDYFEALNKPDGRTIQLTPVGRPFAVGADDIDDGSFTAYGEPGREVCWLVKAERYGGDFLLEEPQADTPTPHPDPAAET